jgi:hypothetical protein
VAEKSVGEIAMKKMKPIVGCDPGVSGAFATIAREGLVRIDDMPLENGVISPVRTHDLLRALDPGLLVVEHVTNLRTFSQKLGMSLGMVVTLAAVLRIAVYLVQPRTWKSHFGLRADKHDSLKLARELWPAAAARFKRVTDHNRAEAALIAEWGLANVQQIWGKTQPIIAEEASCGRPD